MAVATITDNELLTREEAAKFLGVMRGTLEVWASTRRYPSLRYVKVGRCVRYRRADLEAWLESRTIGTTRVDEFPRRASGGIS